MASQPDSVLFCSPSSMAVSVLISANWKRPLIEILIEAGATGAFGNWVVDVSSKFLEWCLAQQQRTFDSFCLDNIPGLPFSGVEWDRWEWYDKLMQEVASWESPPLLVDLDEGQITHNDVIVWPPVEYRRERSPKPVVPPGEPFAAGWYGTGIGRVRRDIGTYTYFTPAEVPSIAVPMNGTFDWLQRASAKRPMASTGGIAACLDRLLSSEGTRLPDAFVAFFRSPALWQKIRSCTDCYFSLDTTAVEIPGGLGWLVCFMSDSQDCKHWHLYLAPCGTKHAVVATYHYSGSESVKAGGGKPHRRDITTCAKSFEEFMYRFWLENELFYASFAKEDLPPGGAEYLAFYQSSAH